MDTSDSPDRDESTAVPPRDPLRKSVLSQTWVALTSFALVLVLIIDFVAQNTAPFCSPSSSGTGACH